MPLSTQPYKGARDFYPEDKRLQKFMFQKLRRSVESFGYEEYDAPILEPLEIYLAKTGSEIVNEQTYNFTDRGGREVVIRPEMTPTVSRMVAAKRQELSYPLRWYSIPNLWRYERPQRGRLREHWQLNVDLFGISTIAAELEMISLIQAIFEGYGATVDMYTIQLNNRPLVNAILRQYLALDESVSYSVAKLIDKMNKMTPAAFESSVNELLTPEQRAAGLTPKLQAVLAAKSLGDLPEELASTPAAQELASVIQQLYEAGITNVIYDATLMRGFDYYTGIVFEVSDTHPENNRSMMGGGRYDGLVGLFGVEPVATIGFAMGDATLANFLEIHGLIPPLSPETDLYIALVGIEPAAVQLVVRQLRQAGLNVAVDTSNRKLGDQLKTAEKKGLQNVLVIGEKELASQRYSLKNLASGEQTVVSVNDVVTQFGTRNSSS